MIQRLRETGILFGLEESLRSTSYAQLEGPSITVQLNSCRILPCIKTYTAEIERSILKETSTSEHMIPFAAGSPAQEYQVADLRCVHETNKQILRDMVHDLETNEQWLPYEVLIQQSATTQLPDCSRFCDSIPPNQIEKFCDVRNLNPEFTQLAPAEYVYVYLISKKTTVQPTGTCGRYTMYPTAVQALSEDVFSMLFNSELAQDFTERPSGSDPSLAMWYAGTGNGTLEDFRGLIKNMSDALTIYLRDNGPVFRSAPIVGEVHYTTV